MRFKRFRWEQCIEVGVSDHMEIGIGLGDLFQSGIQKQDRRRRFRSFLLNECAAVRALARGKPIALSNPQKPLFRFIFRSPFFCVAILCNHVLGERMGKVRVGAANPHPLILLPLSVLVERKPIRMILKILIGLNPAVQGMVAGQVVQRQPARPIFIRPFLVFQGVVDVTADLESWLLGVVQIGNGQIRLRGHPLEFGSVEPDAQMIREQAVDSVKQAALGRRSDVQDILVRL